MGPKEGVTLGPTLDVNKMGEGSLDAMAEVVPEGECRAGSTIGERPQKPQANLASFGNEATVVPEPGPYSCCLTFPVCIFSSIYSPKVS